VSFLALVTGRLAPGVWRTDPGARDELATLASGLGWNVRSGAIPVIDDKQAYITALAEILDAPSYVRSNWDSLADGLRDVVLDRHALWLIEPAGASSFDAVAQGVLEDTIDFWERNGRLVTVVWFGALQAPQLDDVDPPRRSRRSE